MRYDVIYKGVSIGVFETYDSKEFPKAHYRYIPNYAGIKLVEEGELIFPKFLSQDSMFITADEVPNFIKVRMDPKFSEGTATDPFRLVPVM